MQQRRSLHALALGTNKTPRAKLHDATAVCPAVPRIAATGTGLYAECMKTLQYVHWQHESVWIGYLAEFPDYWTQGETRDDLEENLKDLYQELVSGRIPEVRQVAELRIA